MNRNQELSTPSTAGMKTSAEFSLSDYLLFLCQKNNLMAQNHLQQLRHLYNAGGISTSNQGPSLPQQDLANVYNIDQNLLNMMQLQRDQVNSSAEARNALNYMHGDNSANLEAIKINGWRNLLLGNQPANTNHTEKHDVQDLNALTDELEDEDLYVGDELVMDLTPDDDAESSSTNGKVVAELPLVEAQRKTLIGADSDDKIAQRQLNSPIVRSFVHEQQSRQAQNLKVETPVIRVVDDEFRRIVEFIKEANNIGTGAAKKSASEMENGPLDLTPRNDTAPKEDAPVDLTAGISNPTGKVHTEVAETVDVPHPVNITPNKPIQGSYGAAEVNGKGLYEVLLQMTEQKKAQQKIEKEMANGLAVPNFQPNTANVQNGNAINDTANVQNAILANGTANVQNELKRSFSASRLMQSIAAQSQNGDDNLESETTHKVPVARVAARAPRKRRASTTYRGINAVQRARNKSFTNFVANKLNKYSAQRRKEVEKVFNEILLNADKGYFDRIPSSPSPLFHPPPPAVQSAPVHPPMQFNASNHQIRPTDQANPQTFRNAMPFNNQLPQQSFVNSVPLYPPQQTIQRQYNPQLALQYSQYIQNHRYDPNVPSITPNQQMLTNQFNASVPTMTPTQKTPTSPFDVLFGASESRQQLPNQQYGVPFANQQPPTNQYEQRLAASISNQQLPIFLLGQQPQSIVNQQSPIIASDQSPTISSGQSPAAQEQPPHPVLPTQFQTAIPSSSQYSGISPVTISLESSDNEDLY